MDTAYTQKTKVSDLHASCVFNDRTIYGCVLGPNMYTNMFPLLPEGKSFVVASNNHQLIEESMGGRALCTGKLAPLLVVSMALSFGDC